jgi:predicted membrane protein
MMINSLIAMLACLDVQVAKIILPVTFAKEIVYCHHNVCVQSVIMMIHSYNFANNVLISVLRALMEVIVYHVKEIE